MKPLKKILYASLLLVATTVGIPSCRHACKFICAGRNVDVKVYRDPGCNKTNDYPLAIDIVNHSVRTVSRVNVTVRMRERGRSTDLDGDTVYPVDLILKPGEKGAWCYAAPKLPENADLKVDDYVVYWE